MAVAEPSGFAIRRNGSCLSNEVDCGGTYPPWHACCPAGSSCPAQYNVNCCPSSANCTQDLVSNPNCANKTWTLYDNAGYFCCDQDTSAYNFQDSDGCQVSGAILPSGAVLLPSLKAGLTISTSASSNTLSSSSTTSQTSGASPTSSSSASGGQDHAGTIAGGVVGGVAIIALAVCALLYLRHYQKKNATAPASFSNGYAAIKPDESAYHGPPQTDHTSKGLFATSEADGVERFELHDRNAVAKPQELP